MASRHDGPPASERSAPAAGRPLLSTRVLGARAEHLVAAHLASLGLEIVAMNVRVGRLEIDVVARDGPVIVVVEVRSRGPGAWVRPFDSVDREKRARVRRAGAQLWRNRFARDPSAERMRFDLASVDFAAEGEPRIEIVKAAF